MVANNIDPILEKITVIEHGFRHILDALEEVLSQYSEKECLDIAISLTTHEAYQVRMLSTALLGRLAASKHIKAYQVLKEHIGLDPNWRVQEMLAMAFDTICRGQGYEQSLPIIQEWLSDKNPNIIRAVTEGLRVWTSRPFFKEHIALAIELLSQHKAHKSEYVRKSVGNALKDISKKHAGLIAEELAHWDLSNPLIRFTHKHACKNLQ
ncbi:MULTISPECIES: DNA alkylation repair protein [unclassified Porphyromonas]|uniref:DNA alkylation repair protein n=1 Tax=unclassified Porphyromonas TaxID=2645799 RepID=UPI00052DCEA6|nr:MULTISPECIES: DNA alkylation repair protein [unclassified Porphyromonas]KGN83506.1 DNA alkylation repair enzyme [Porphyromonas sp. COT-290 OH860]KGN97857.1 DNA alkylation repair enzyme [Porphyromonas sp. COT-290 OH3588]